MPIYCRTITCPARHADLDVTSYDGTHTRFLPAQYCDCGRRVEVDDLSHIDLPTPADLAPDRTEPELD